jgi:hypothetical protein
MVAWNLGPTWADRTRLYARGSTRPIHGTLRLQTEKGFLIDTATRERVWLPKKLVSHDAAAGVFMVPSWLAAEKVLD